MASCEEYEILMSQSLDGELSPEEDVFLHAHLESCPACCELFCELTNMHDSFSRLSLSPPPSLHMRVMDQIKKEASPPPQKDNKIVRPSVFYRRYATTAAAFLILISAVVFGPKLFPSHLAETVSPGTDPEIATTEQNQRSLPQPEPEQASQEPSNSLTIEDEKPIASSHGSKSYGKVAPPPVTTEKPQTTTPPIATITAPPPTPPADTLTEFSTKNLTGFAASISQSDAEKLLTKLLVDDGQTEPKPTFLRLREDTSSYLFQYTDSSGATWLYSVSLFDGSIERTPLPSNYLSTFN